MTNDTSTLDLQRDDKGDFNYPETHLHDAGVGLTEQTVHYISNLKEDPAWVRDFRLNGLKTFFDASRCRTHWAES